MWIAMFSGFPHGGILCHFLQLIMVKLSWFVVWLCITTVVCAEVITTCAKLQHLPSTSDFLIIMFALHQNTVSIRGTSVVVVSSRTAARLLERYLYSVENLFLCFHRRPPFWTSSVYLPLPILIVSWHRLEETLSVFVLKQFCFESSYQDYMYIMKRERELMLYHVQTQNVNKKHPNNTVNAIILNHDIWWSCTMCEH